MKRIVVLALIAVVSGVLSGCGSGDDAEPLAGGDQTTTSTVVAADGTPITVLSMVPSDAPGDGAGWARRTAGFLAAVMAENALRGGVHGRPIAVEVCDAGAFPHAAGVDCLRAGDVARPVLLANHVLAGPEVQALADERLLVGVGGSDLRTLGASRIDDSSVLAAPLLALELGLGSMAEAGLNAMPLQWHELVEEARRQIGVERRGVGVDITADPANGIRALVGTEAEVVYLESFVAGRLMPAIDGLAGRTLILGRPLADGAPPSLPSTFDGRAFALLGSVPVWAEEHPAIVTFNEEMDRAGASGATPVPRDDRTLDGWITGRAVVALLESMGPGAVISAETVAAHAREVRDLDLGPVVAPWTPFPQGDDALGGSSLASFFVAARQDGAWVLWREEQLCGDHKGC